MSKVQDNIAVAFAEGQKMVANQYAIIERDGGHIRSIQMHATEVIRYDLKLGILTIKHGGHLTVTTKNMINTALEALGSPVFITGSTKQWVVNTPDSKFYFPAGGVVKVDMRGNRVEPKLVHLVS